MNLKKRYLNFKNNLDASRTAIFIKPFWGEIGHKSIVYRQLRLKNTKNIFLGHSVILFPNSRIELITSHSNKTFKPRLTIGNESQIHQNCHITCANNINIGENVIVVANVTITDIIHPYLDPFTPINKTEIETNPVSIGDQTYIYNNSIILPGTTIGKHCIIGANSVVSGSFEDYCVIVGSPAKVIKQYNFKTKRWEKL